MMRLGVAIREAVHGTDDDILRALDVWAAQAGAMPALFPLWRSLDTRGGRYGPPSRALMAGLDSRGVRPVIYLGSCESRETFDGYAALLAGKHDAALAFEPPCIVRWDHEMNASWVPWQTTPGRYTEAFRYVAAHTFASMHWCPQATTPRRIATMARYFPGDDVLGFAGFDYYDLGGRRGLGRAWAKPIAVLRTLTAKPILVGEFGSKITHPPRGRLRWLRSLADVKGVWGAIYFDLDMTAEEGLSWLMHPAMRHAYGGLA